MAAAATLTGQLPIVPVQAAVVKGCSRGFGPSVRCGEGFCFPSFVRWDLEFRMRTRSRGSAMVVQVRSRMGGSREGYFAARDREIEFGKFKGSPLGTMSSKYLKWMAKNLRNGPQSEWAEYAEEVLEDPYYQDRLEWEKVEKLMTMAHDVDKITGNRDVLAPAKVFGWDLENDTAWRKVNFALLGTTRGGRIPRVDQSQGLKAAAKQVEKKKRIRRQTVSIRTQPASLSTPEAASEGSLRDELERRRATRRDRLMANRSFTAAQVDEDANRVMNPFPGRDSLVSKTKVTQTARVDILSS
ncbi:hypothetical protein R1sor_015319 [Riccia sorocarpa]|uniref:Uncharacterized protein n=1 Tax=Riccia sorocarpa TaxID=122646 RepID=A0ABD3HBX0_9MARC